jgi:hypothetical protein
MGINNKNQVIEAIPISYFSKAKEQVKSRIFSFLGPQDLRLIDLSLLDRKTYHQSQSWLNNLFCIAEKNLKNKKNKIEKMIGQMPVKR